MPFFRVPFLQIGKPLIPWIQILQLSFRLDRVKAIRTILRQEAVPDGLETSLPNVPRAIMLLEKP